MGLWQAVKSMSNQATKAWIKSWRRQRSSKGMLNDRSSGLFLYRSSVMTGVGSVTTAFISTVSTSGSDSATSFIGVILILLILSQTARARGGSRKPRRLAFRASPRSLVFFHSLSTWREFVGERGENNLHPFFSSL